MDDRIKSTLNGKAIKIQWRSRKKLNEVQDLASEFSEKAFDLGMKIATAKTKKTRDKLNAQAVEDQIDYYLKSGAIMFEFDDGFPEREWWADEDFPQGEFEAKQQLFYSPIRKT